MNAGENKKWIEPSYYTWCFIIWRNANGKSIGKFRKSGCIPMKWTRIKWQFIHSSSSTSSSPAHVYERRHSRIKFEPVLRLLRFIRKALVDDRPTVGSAQRSPHICLQSIRIWVDLLCRRFYDRSISSATVTRIKWTCQCSSVRPFLRLGCTDSPSCFLFIFMCLLWFRSSPMPSQRGTSSPACFQASSSAAAAASSSSATARAHVFDNNLVLVQ